MMTASEMQFTIAEAAYRKGDKATALAAYTNAISLNFDMLTTTYEFKIPAGRSITPAAKAAYLANTAVVPANQRRPEDDPYNAAEVYRVVRLGNSPDMDRYAQISLH